MTIAIGLVLACVPRAGEARAAVKPAPKPAPVQSAWQQEQTMTPSQLIRRWQPLVTRASRRAGVPVAWINAVMRVESGGRTMLGENQPMVSAKGALGLMQVLPGTYQDMRVQYRLGPDPFDPKDNISAGAGYLRWLRGKYGYPAMFAAYNAGPGQIDNVLGGAARLPAETQSYVARVGQILGTSVDGAVINAATFTRPDGTPVQIDPLAVGSVRAVEAGEYPDGVQAVLVMGRLRQAVREDTGAVIAQIRLRGGKV